jgi:hypothetical protein
VLLKEGRSVAEKVSCSFCPLRGLLYAEYDLGGGLGLDASSLLFGSKSLVGAASHNDRTGPSRPASELQEDFAWTSTRLIAPVTAQAFTII